MRLLRAKLSVRSVSGSLSSRLGECLSVLEGKRYGRRRCDPPKSDHIILGLSKVWIWGMALWSCHVSLSQPHLGS
jgi:hypothetical protein